MKQQYHLFIIALFFTAFAIAQVQGPITVDNTTYTPQQLIQDILITGDCANTSNFSSYTGTTAGNNSVNGIGYFERGTSINGLPDNFPFANGIVLSTGDATKAPGPNTNYQATTLSDGSWPEHQSEQLANVSGSTAGNYDLTNESFIEFDFIPPTNVINFNYIFVSEEYNKLFECSYSDVFAFILTDLTTGVVTNIAVLPTTNTGDSFVTCKNVRPEVPGTCNAANEQYFDKYNFDDADPTVEANSPIAYNGQTVPLTATANVTPGNQYKIRLAVADSGTQGGGEDSSYDAAVFLEGGSFGLGITLDVTGLQIVNGTANACNGTDVHINGAASGNTQLPIDYQWSDIAGPIVGETTDAITVTTSGVYTLTGSFTFPDGSNCSDSQSIIVNFFDVPVANQPQDLILCSTNGTDFEPFTLTENDDDVLGGQIAADFTISYHLTQDDADNDVGPLTSPYTNITNPQTIFVRIENNGNTDCFATNSFNLSVGAATSATQPANPILRICDDLADGTENFDLTQFDTEILGTQSNTAYTISYHLLEVDANNDANPIINTNPYPSAVPVQIIWVRVEDNNNSDCNAVTSFTIFVDHIPVAVQPLEMRNCDVAPLGEETFDLTIQNATILGGLNPALYTVTYHWVDNTNPTTPVDMPIADPTAHTTIAPALSQEIFTTVSNNDNTSCSTVTSFFIFRDPIYTTAVPSTDLNLTECDYNNSGDMFEVFNLDAQIPTILGTGVPVTDATVTFYLVEADATANTVANSITNAPTNSNTAAFTSTTTNVAPFTQTIYYTISNNDNVTCFSTGSFELRVDGLPDIIAPTTAFQACDLDIIDGFTDFDFASPEAIQIINTIIQGNTTYSVSFFANATDAQNNNNVLPTLYNNQANQTVHVRIEDTITNCVTYTTLNLEVMTAPQSFPFTNPIVYCDTDNDTFGYFDLNTIVSDLTGNTPGVVVEFFETEAEANYSAVNSPSVGVIDTSVLYENVDADGDGIGSTQTIYAQLSVNGLECVTLVEVNLLVINSPVLPSDDLVYAQCEEMPDITDGIVVFDLPSYEQTTLYAEIIAAGGDTSEYTATYYTALLASGNPDPAFIIGTPNAFPNQTTPDQVIYVVVTHTGSATVPGTGCSIIKEITLHVDLLPTALYTPIEVCDDDDSETIGDGFIEFDLTDYISIITGGATNVSVDFYTDQAEAEAGVGASLIATPTAYTNTVNPQAIFARVYNPITGCYAVAIVRLHVNPNPTPLSNAQIIATLGNNGVMEECDGNVDGSGAISEQVAEFDLTQWEIAILNGESGVSAAYYTSFDDAAAEINAITNPATYTNIANPQTIYVSVLNDGFGINPITSGSGCYTIVEFQLYVPIPEVDVVADKTVICVDANGVPLTNTSLPLLTATAGPQAVSSYDYQWLLNGSEIPGATNQTLSVTLPGDYTVTVSGPTDLDCINISQVVSIEVSGVPQGYDANVATNAFAGSHEIIAEATSTIPGIVFWFSLDGGEPTTDGTFTNVSPGLHTVTITDGKDCWTKDEIVTIIDYPHFFTPNGDGINDTWAIIGQEGIPISQIYIFDRFGKLLSQLDPDGEGWDGTYNGSQMPASDYWFKIIYVEGDDSTQKELKAHFSLKR